MNKTIVHFLDRTCSHIKYPSVRKEVREELGRHLQDHQAVLQSEGMEEEQAAAEAVSAMGSADVLGQELDRQHRPHTDWPLLLLTAAMVLAGCVTMYLCGLTDSRPISLSSYLISAGLGLAVMAFLLFFNYTKLADFSGLIYLCLLAVFLVALALCQPVNGRQALIVGRVQVQLEFLSCLFLVPLAGFFNRYRQGGWPEICKLMGLAAVPSLLLLLFPALSAALLFAGAFAVMLFAAVLKGHFRGSKKAYIFLLLGIGLLVLLFLFFRFQPFHSERFQVFLTRGASDPAGGGWQTVMADRWLAKSKWIGPAPAIAAGEAISNTLPGVYSEFVLVNFIAHFGWLPGIFLIGVICVLIWRLFTVAGKTKNPFGATLSYFACTLLALKFVTAVLMNFGLLPLTAISLPLISYGGSDYVTTLCLIGLVLTVYRHNDLVPAAAPTPSSLPGKHRLITYIDGKLVIDLKGE